MLAWPLAESRGDLMPVGNPLAESLGDTIPVA
jgi:hypothetical protein